MNTLKTLTTVSLMAALASPVLAIDVKAARAAKRAAGAYEGSNGGVVRLTMDAVCDNAEIITFGSSVLGSNVGGIDHVGELSPDVFYKLVVPFPAEVTISTCASADITSFDGFMSLYESCPTAGGNLINDADDSCDMMPSITEYLSIGTYFIVMEGFDENEGEWQLDVSIASNPCETYSPTEMTFVNGHYHTILDLSTGSNIYAGGGNDVGFTFTLNAPSSFLMDACRNGSVGVDSDSYLLTGTCGNFTEVMYVDGRGECDWQTYQDFGCNEGDVLPAGTYTLLFSTYNNQFAGQIEFDAYIGTCGNEIVGADEQPLAFSLGAAVPNPFNPSTTIAFSVAQTGPASLKVFDLAGHTVATLVDGMVEAGSHSAIFDGSQLASGVYFATLQAGDMVQSQKMVLVK